MAAADGFFRCVYEASITGYDNQIDKRPYHKNCRCAIHERSRNRNCPHASPRGKSLSFPMRRVYSEGCLSLASSGQSSPSSSPVVVGRG